MREIIMNAWERFEIDSEKYLNSKFTDYASFHRQGGADSTIPDILVQTNKGESFYIEAKHCPAQCGQFVLLPNIKNQEFDYSTLNKTPQDEFSKTIISHMNNYFEEFKEAGTAGKDIIFSNSENVFSKWIINTYMKSEVKFIITNNYKLLPIEEFDKHFYITAKYRVKRSGSSSVGIGKIDKIINFIEQNNYKVNNYYSEKGKLFVSSSINIHDKRFVYDNYEYMFSKRATDFEVRKLSNTFNANVIFSISSKRTIGLTDDEFIDKL